MIDNALKSLTINTSNDSSYDNTHSSFKAKPAPSSTRKPKIEPQLSRTALLRMGIKPPEKERRRSSVNINNTPHEKRKIEKPSSLSTPKYEVRQTRSSHLRAKSEIPYTPKTNSRAVTPNNVSSKASSRSSSIDSLNTVSTASKQSLLFANTPGHRRQSLQINVSSVKPPSITPRQTRASTLRQGGEYTPNNNSRRVSKTPQETFANTPGHKRALSIPVKSINDPLISARGNRSSMLRAKRMSMDVSNTLDNQSSKPAFNLSTRINNEKFVDFDKSKVKPIRKVSWINI